MVAKQAAGIAGSAAGGAAGGFFNNPGVIAIAGIAITIITTLLIFRKDIGEFFGNLRLPELPEINLPGLPDITFPSFDFEFPTFEFPDITFPTFEFPTFEFPDINIFGFGDDEDEFVPFSQETDPEDFPTEDPLPAVCECGSTIVQDASGQVTQTCLACAPEPGDPDFIGPVDPGPFTGPGPFQELPPDELPPGFVGGGPSFEGGSIFDLEEDAPFEITESTTLSDIIDEFGVSASKAADILFTALEFPTSTFDFGESTGRVFPDGA